MPLLPARLEYLIGLEKRGLLFHRQSAVRLRHPSKGPTQIREEDAQKFGTLPQ
jgi:hypothetical protein